MYSDDLIESEQMYSNDFISELVFHFKGNPNLLGAILVDFTYPDGELTGYFEEIPRDDLYYRHCPEDLVDFECSYAYSEAFDLYVIFHARRDIWVFTRPDAFTVEGSRDFSEWLVDIDG